MSALILEELPPYLPIIDDLLEPYQGIRGHGEIRWVLIRPYVDRLFRGKLVPLLAGDLTCPTGGAPRDID
jgi:hypothetical protein